MKRVPRYRTEWLQAYESVFGTDDPHEVNQFKAAELDSRWGSCNRRRYCMRDMLASFNDHV